MDANELTDSRMDPIELLLAVSSWLALETEPEPILTAARLQTQPVRRALPEKNVTERSSSVCASSKLCGG